MELHRPQPKGNQHFTAKKFVTFSLLNITTFMHSIQLGELVMISFLCIIPVMT
jgi:hypothetical protein